MILLTFLLLLSGFNRLTSEGYTFESVLLSGAGIILTVLLAANIVWRIINQRKQ
jgi:hypothetical protein